MRKVENQNERLSLAEVLKHSCRTLTWRARSKMNEEELEAFVTRSEAGNGAAFLVRSSTALIVFADPSVQAFVAVNCAYS